MINIIIPHFQTFSLLSKKRLSFILWSKAVELLKKGDHKTEHGFIEILSIYAAIGRGSSNKVKNHFPTIVPAVLPDYDLKDVALEPWWLSGYLTIYCHFELNVLRPVLYYIPISIHLLRSLVPRRVRYRALPLAGATPYAETLGAHSTRGLVTVESRK